MTIKKEGEIYLVYEDVHKIGTIEKEIDLWEFYPNGFSLNNDELIQISKFIKSL